MQGNEARLTLIPLGKTTDEVCGSAGGGGGGRGVVGGAARHAGGKQKTASRNERLTR